MTSDKKWSPFCDDCGQNRNLSSMAEILNKQLEEANAKIERLEKENSQLKKDVMRWTQESGLAKVQAAEVIEKYRAKMQGKGE